MSGEAFLVARQAFDAGRWMWLIVGGSLDGQWVDSPTLPMAPIRAATPAELDEAKRAYWRIS